jgi:hypothetical protein
MPLKKFVKPYTKNQRLSMKSGTGVFAALP